MPPTQELAEIETRLGEIKTALAAKMAEGDHIVDSIKVDEKGTLIVDKEKADAFHSNIGEMKQMRQALEDLEERKQLLVWGTKPEADPVAVAAAAAAAAAFGRPGAKGIGRQFIESEAFQTMRQAGLREQQIPFELKVMDLPSLGRGMQQKDVYSALPTGDIPHGFGQIFRDTMVPLPQRRNRVRDLFPARPTTAAVIEYFRVTGLTNSASVVPERNVGNTAFADKPQSGLTFIGEQAPVRTIAHYEIAHRSALEDEPQLEGIIEDLLLYGLRLREDDQILNGTGTGQDLQGILSAKSLTAGVQTYSWSAGDTLPVPDNKADALRRAATKAFLEYYEPTGVVVNDNDWEDIELVKDKNGQYLLAVSIALGGEPRVWRMPVVSTQAIASGTALVGAFGIGAQLYDRMMGNIRISEHHASLFTQNGIAVLAEERLALAVRAPESFVKVTFDHAPA